MKNKLLILIIGFLIISCGTKKTRTSPLKFENGWYFITKSKTNSNLIKSRFKDYFVNIEPNPIVKASDYAKIKIAKQNWGGKETSLLELIYDGEEMKKWADATERMSKTGEEAVFVYKDKFISRVSAFRRMNNGYAGVSNDNFNDQILLEIMEGIKK